VNDALYPSVCTSLTYIREGEGAARSSRSNMDVPFCEVKVARFQQPLNCRSRGGARREPAILKNYSQSTMSATLAAFKVPSIDNELMVNPLGTTSKLVSTDIG
jgi:hypothetical protein